MGDGDESPLILNHSRWKRVVSFKYGCGWALRAGLDTGGEKSNLFLLPDNES